MSTPENPQAMRSLQLEFTGSGQEYFRIWIVNLCLTLLSFGVYGAWAKVRRMQYFYRNTRLQQAVFDFHGKASRILLGRVLALCLLALYQYAFGFSAAMAAAVVMVLLLLLPMMARGALRFRLANSSYRGLRFAFDGKPLHAWLAYGPLLCLLLLPPLLIYLDAGVWLAAVGLLYLAWPLMHWRMQHYQYANLRWGPLHSACTARPRDFVSNYAKALLLAIVTILLAAMLVAGLFGDLAQEFAQSLVALLTALVIFSLAYLFTFPWLQGRLLNLILHKTCFGPLHFRSSLPLGGYMWLASKNALLTILTLGLYRPFAVVALWRFRLQHLHLHAPESLWLQLEQASAENQEQDASGEGVADLFGFDLSW
ncbi:YjgN family protein [Massilia sp. W12]|uniref:YjgN family protein n=1 Tax=Massilia sp. W12 TaxID=3126507 RepID=UPI0030D445CD